LRGRHSSTLFLERKFSQSYKKHILKGFGGSKKGEFDFQQSLCRTLPEFETIVPFWKREAFRLAIEPLRSPKSRGFLYRWLDGPKREL
jgi:hypothetical protein